MIVAASGWQLLEPMLRRVTIAGGTRLPPGVTGEPIERARVPESLRALLSHYPGAAAALNASSTYEVLRIISEEPQLVREARTMQGQDIRLVAVAENMQVVTTDPLTFVPLDGDDRVPEPATCYGCRFEEGHWLALDRETTLDLTLAWQWGRAFTALGYEASADVLTVAWRGSDEQLAELLDAALGLPRAPVIQARQRLGHIEDAGAWLASRRPSGTYRVYLGGPHRLVRSVTEALDDVNLRQKGIKPR